MLETHQILDDEQNFNREILLLLYRLDKSHTERERKVISYEIYLVLQENLDIFLSERYKKTTTIIKRKFKELKESGFDIADVCLTNLQL